MSPRITALVGSFEVGMALIGAVMAWWLVLRPAARAKYPGPKLAAWNAPLSEIFVFLAYLIGGTFLLGLAASVVSKSTGLRGDAATVVTAAGGQLGMLLGVIFYWLQPGRDRPRATLGFGATLLSGLATFLMCLPAVLIVAAAWEQFLVALKLPTEKQDLVSMFVNAESPWLLTVMITLAVVIAPVTEELVFRAGFYRFLRLRIPRWLALIAPALIFASLHVNWVTLQGLSSLAPLTLLAVLFSVAYERTGNIGTSIVAHAIFNLNTVALIFARVGL